MHGCCMGTLVVPLGVCPQKCCGHSARAPYCASPAEIFRKSLPGCIGMLPAVPETSLAVLQWIG